MSDYTSLATMKAALGMTGTGSDADLARCITAASRAFDRLCMRPDNAFVATTATKVFDVKSYQVARIYVPPLQSLTTLKTDEDGDGTYEVTWSVVLPLRDYILQPSDGPPYTWIEVDGILGRYYFPAGQRTVQIVGSWGYSVSAPPDVERATIILANRLANRAKTPEGIMGNAEGGYITLREVDPDVALIVRQYTSDKVFA